MLKKRLLWTRDTSKKLAEISNDAVPVYKIRGSGVKQGEDKLLE